MKLIKFQAEWCGPCRMLSKILDELNIDIDTEVVDIDKESDKVKAYGVRGIPTLVLLDDNGVEQGRLTGMQDRSTLKSFLLGD